MRRAHPSGLTQFNPTHRMTEQVEWKQRLEREQQAKHNVERLNAICNHSKELLASNCVAQERIMRLSRAVRMSTLQSQLYKKMKKYKMIADGKDNKGYVIFCNIPNSQSY